MTDLAQFAGLIQELSALYPNGGVLEQTRIVTSDFVSANRIASAFAEGVFDLNQLDVDQFNQLIEQLGVELPQGWTLANFVNRVA